MPPVIHLPRHPTFMEQFNQSGAVNNILRSIEFGIQRRMMEEKEIRGLQKEGYVEADYTAPTPQEVQAGYRGAAPGQYKGAVYDPSRQVDVAGRRFQRPPEPEMSFGVEKGKGGQDWDVVRKGGKLFKVARSKTATQPSWQRGQRVIEKINPKTGKKQTWVQEYDYNPKTRERIDVNKPYRSKVGGDTNVTTNVKMSSPTERENIAKGERTLGMLKELQKLYKGGYTGKVSGTMGKVKDFFGKNPQKQSEFYALTAAFNNRLINLITGAAMGEAEAKRIMSEAPSIYDEPSVWQAKWKQSQRNVKMLQEERAKIMRGSGIVLPKLTSEESRSLGWEFMQNPGKGMENYNQLIKNKKDDPFGWE